MKNCPKRSVSEREALSGGKPIQFGQHPLMLRSAMMIRPNLARWSVMKMRRNTLELLRDKNMRDELSGLLEVLDDRERKIISKRFGLDEQQCQNSRRSWREIRSDQRADPAVARIYRLGETA